MTARKVVNSEVVAGKAVTKNVPGVDAAPKKAGSAGRTNARSQPTAGSKTATMASLQRGAGSRTARERTGRSKRAAAAVAAILVDAAPAEVDHLLAATSKDGEQTLDTALWGAGPSVQDIAAGVLANVRKQFESRRELELASVSRAEAAELLGTSEQAVTDALEAHRLLGLKRGRRWFIPAWQFDPEGERGVLQGLDELSRVFPGGLISLSSWVNRPNADLHERSPREELVRGEVEPVVRIARSLTAVGW